MNGFETYVYIYTYVLNNQFLDILSTMETYRPHYLKKYVIFFVESKFLIEKTHLFYLDQLL